MGERIHIRNSIAMQIWKIVFSFYFLVTLILTAIQCTIEYNSNAKQLDQELISLQNLVEPTLAETLWHKNNDQLIVSLKALLNNTSIVGIKIIQKNSREVLATAGHYLDEDKKPLFSPGIKIHPLSIDDYSKDEVIRDQEIFIDTEEINANENIGKKSFVEDHLISHHFPVRYLGLNIFPVAEVTIYSSVSVILERIWPAFFVIFINALIKTFALWVIFLVVSRIFLTRPLSALTEAARQIDLGELEKFKLNLKLKTKNELQTLGKSFSIMVGKLLVARKNMEESHQNTKILAKDLKRLNQIKDEFLANTSHELRTPLNAIVGLSESLLDGVAGLMTSQQKMNLKMIIKSGRGLSRLINDLLDFSQIQQNALSLHLGPIRLNSIIPMLVISFEPLISKK